MPEGLEVERYRAAAAATIGRVVSTVRIDDRQEQSSEIRSALTGATVTAVGRLGKQLWLDVAPPAAATRSVEEGGRVDPVSPDDGRGSRRGSVRVGLHFGMAGRLAVDGVPVIDVLSYSASRWATDWNRFELTFTAETGGGSLLLNDPRRWSRVVLEPDLSLLGPDLLTIDDVVLERRLATRCGALKAVLLDQSVVAGLGNMLVDEATFGVGLAPQRRVETLGVQQVRRLGRWCQDNLPQLLAAGGSAAGILSPSKRAELGRCPGPPVAPECRGTLARDRVGGRTTVWCQRHQR